MQESTETRAARALAVVVLAAVVILLLGSVGAPSALEKTEAAGGGGPTASIKRGSAHLCIVDPLGRRLTNREGWLADRLATHPPLSMRISLLKGMGYAQLKQEGGLAV